ncbi:MAG: hypothetical protein P8P74_17435 [Crocinitomicaceae bacterium]|nr:hypothetical protein [Crocinitomicaceae bacterium]
MKKTIASLTLFGTLLVISSCGEAPEPVENEYGWTFCSCNSAYMETKVELVTETDAEEREILEIELEIMEKECGNFLTKAMPGTEEYKEHSLKKIECR